MELTCLAKKKEVSNLVRRGDEAGSTEGAILDRAMEVKRARMWTLEGWFALRMTYNTCLL